MGSYRVPQAPLFLLDTIAATEDPSTRRGPVLNLTPTTFFLSPMASLHSLLNHGAYQNSLRTGPDTLPESASPSPSTSRRSDRSAMETAHYTRDDGLPGEHEPHEDCPDTLGCLPDSDGRPQHTLPVILRCAILGSPRKRLTIREIYAAMEGKYPYYKTAGPTWKQSVRHHLSLNRLFERQPRPVTEPGFGSYWTVNLSAPPGTKRPRKRGRANKDSMDDPLGAPPPAKKRGRPRKIPAVQLPSISSMGVTADRSVRPCQVSSVRTGGERLDDDDEEMTEEGTGTGDRTDDDYESEDDENRTHRFEDYSQLSQISQLSARSPLSAQSPFPSAVRPLVPASFPQFGGPNDGDNLIDKLQNEMEGLRRMASDAQVHGQRASEQLSEAQGEAQRAKAALKRAESLLEEEGRKRLEAEKMADDESRRRRAAEEALRHAQLHRPPGRST